MCVALNTVVILESFVATFIEILLDLTSESELILWNLLGSDSPLSCEGKLDSQIAEPFHVGLSAGRLLGRGGAARMPLGTPRHHAVNGGLLCAVRAAQDHFCFVVRGWGAPVGIPLLTGVLLVAVEETYTKLAKVGL